MVNGGSLDSRAAPALLSIETGIYQMKKWALMAIAAAAASVAATPAMADNGGYVGLRYADGNVDQNIGGDYDVTSWQGEGELGWNTGAWGGQVGATYGNVDLDALGDTNFGTFNGHLFWGNDAWKIGGFITYSTVDDFDVDEWNYGVESAFNFGPDTTFYASGSLGTLSDSTDDYDDWNVDFGIGHYFSDNFRLAGNVGWGSVQDIGLGSDADTQTYGINAEWQFSSIPISIVGGYNVFNVDAGPLNADTDYFSIGARWNFGGSTLRERNNSTPFTQPGGYGTRLYGVGTF